jgi:CRISPR system Cascade subunit CasA
MLDTGTRWEIWLFLYIWFLSENLQGRAMNLLKDPWLLFNVQQLDGSIIEKTLPINAITQPEVIDFALPRADFQGAAYQFAIGLLQTCFAPKDEFQWEDHYLQPPTEKVLQQAFSKAEHAFNVTGDGPLFMQDFDSLDEAKQNSVSGLLIEAPGGNGLKLNTDHFVKRGVGSAMSLSMAVMALFTLQINAPAGGQGNRTGLRGGGPLTTLVMPQQEHAPLWQKLWLNITPKDNSYPEPDLHSDTVFPWLGKTRVSSKKGSETYQKDVHPLHMFWAMPRRIRLIIEDGAGECSLTGKPCSQLVKQYKAQNYGANYAGSWSHPLTPYKRDLKKPEQEDLSVKGQPGGITYKIWDILTLTGSPDKGKTEQMCASVVSNFNQLAGNDFIEDVTAQARLWVFGYDMDNMKARGWYSETMPLYQFPPAKQQQILEHTKQLQTIANDALWHCRSQIKAAWFDKPGDARGDLSFIDTAFWQQTQADFFVAVQRLMNSNSLYLTSEEAKHWLSTLRNTALLLFDEYALSELGAERAMAKRILARKSLMKGLHSKSFKNFEKEHQIEPIKETS